MAAGYSRLYSYTSPRPEYSTSSCYPCPSIEAKPTSQHGMPMMDVRPGGEVRPGCTTVRVAWGVTGTSTSTCTSSAIRVPSRYSIPYSYEYS